MKEETYKKAIETYEKIKELKEAEEQIKKEKLKLTFAWNNDKICGHGYAVDVGIEDILEKHEKMIINEVNEEIERLENSVQDL